MINPISYIYEFNEWIIFKSLCKIEEVKNCSISINENILNLILGENEYSKWDFDKLEGTSEGLIYRYY